MNNDINDFIDELREINDELIEQEWRELGINTGDSPIRAEELPEDFMLPDFEIEEDELLINRDD